MNIFDIPKGEMAKFAAAQKAVELVEHGMNLGLGTGSTANWFVVLLAHRMKSEGLRARCVTTSRQTAELAALHDIPIVSLDEMMEPDLVVDGADEISPELDLIKGGGGALLWEKIVANAGDRVVIIADDSKYVEDLGAFHLPVEVVKFGWRATQENIREILSASPVDSTNVRIRQSGLSPFVTDEGHYIIDCFCERIQKPEQLCVQLNQIPGVVENGLFVGVADTIILGHDNGKVRMLDRDYGDLGYSKVNMPIDLTTEG